MCNKKLENRKFGLIVGTAFVLLCIIFWKGTYLQHLFLLLSLGLIITAIVAPLYLEPIRKIWLNIGHILGVVNGTVLLTLVFIFILSPIAFLRRLFKKQSLKTKKNKQLASYWEEVSDRPIGSFNQQF
ncbi:SxtJ family membrane protein [Pedobacter terrae]|uniref:SxtJ family membrane protein n=1 Tax=Pedobacter terrae TaxID=405671 RepID=UPI002FF56135